MKILLIEDDEDDYILLRSMFSQISGIQYHLSWAPGYSDGIQKMSEETFTAILVDFSLGEKNGLQLIQETQAQDRPEPIILITGHGNFDLDLQAMNAGALDYLVKGEISPPLLERTIRYSIERKQTEINLRKETSRAEFLANLYKETSETRIDLQSLTQLVSQRIASVLGMASIFFLISSDGHFLKPISVYHPKPDGQEQLLNLTANSTGEDQERFQKGIWIETSDHLCTNDTSTIEKLFLQKYCYWFTLIDVKDYAVIPLCTQSGLIGLMFVFSTHADPIPLDFDPIFLRELGNRVAITMDNVLLYHQEQRHTQRMESLQAATRSLLGTLNINKIIQKIMDALQTSIPEMEHGILELAKNEGDEIEVFDRHLFGLGKEDPGYIELKRQVEGLFIQKGKPLGNKKGKTFKRNDAERTWLVSALTIQNQIIGVLGIVLRSSWIDHYHGDLDLVESLAAATSAAIQNTRLHDEVKRLAMTDSLTGLYNRRALAQMGKKEIERSKRYCTPLALIIMDIDRFKSINDSYGHTFGDQVLRTIATNCMQIIRQVDIASRYGGDEFVILLPQTDLVTAYSVAERIREIISGITFDAGGRSVQITISMGISQSTPETQTLEELIFNADKALYLSKQNGSNRIEMNKGVA